MNEQDPREYWRSLPYEDKLLYAVNGGTASAFAYGRLQMHRMAAEVQMSRICAAIANSKSPIPKPESNAKRRQIQDYVEDVRIRMRAVFAEVHLYFVSWAGCRNMLQVLVGQPEFLDAKMVFDRYRKEFEHYVAGRNSFEHFHERLPGQPEASRVKEIQDGLGMPARKVFAGFRSGKYVHSSLEWDISPACYERLDRYVDEILLVVHAKIDEEFVRRGFSE